MAGRKTEEDIETDSRWRGPREFGLSRGVEQCHDCQDTEAEPWLCERLVCHTRVHQVTNQRYDN
jgi:hypothetical protein